MLWEALITTLAAILETDLTTAGMFLSMILILGIILAALAVGAKGEHTLIVAMFSVFLFMSLGWIGGLYGAIMAFAVVIVAAYYATKLIKRD